MERRVILRDRQEQQAADHNNIQEFAAESLDHIVADGIHNGKAFVGFDVTASGATDVTIQPGRLFNAGKVYVRRTSIQRPLIDTLPTVTKRIVAVVAWGTEDESDVQPRDFLIDQTTGETEPQAVPLELSRNAQVATQAGIESPDPQPPIVSADLVVIAFVTLGTGGIEKIEMVDENRLPSVKNNTGRIVGLEAFQARTEPTVATIISDIAKLNNADRGVADENDVFRMAVDLARVKEVINLPDDHAAYGADRYLTADESDTDDLNFLAKVEEGIRFAPANQDRTAMSLFNTLNPNASVTNGFLLPAYTNTKRLQVTGFSGETSLSQYGYSTFELTQKFISRTRIRYGQEFTVCSNSSWWRGTQFDPTTNTLTRAGETFQLLNTLGHKYRRLRQFWVDTYQDAYWLYDKIDHTVSGAQIAQTWLQGQDGWLTQVGLYFTRLAASGNVHLSIVETTVGAPDRSQAIMHLTVDRSSLKTYPQSTVVSIPPTYLEAGKRYAVILTTNADHYVAMASGDSFTQGTFFYSTDGDFFSGDLTRDMMFDLWFARFQHPRVVIDLAPLNLDGGIGALDILAPMVVPKSSNLIFEVQAPGGPWTAISEVSVDALIGLPPLLNLRAVFIGTSDIAPGIDLLGSEVTISRARTNFTHYSTERTLPAPSSEVRVIIGLESWNPANHTATVSILTATGEELADVVETRQVTADTIELTATFILPVAIGSYRIKISGSTSTPLDVFHVSERVDIAF